MSEAILSRSNTTLSHTSMLTASIVDDMGARVDELETSIAQLMKEAGISHELHDEDHDGQVEGAIEDMSNLEMQ